jgi:hypothetical protein
MATLSTTSLNWLANEWEKLYKSAVLSGIVGDLAHKARGGYHISRQDQPKTNYSVIRTDDKPGNGPNDRAAAIDMTMSTADMKKCHVRLRDSWKNRAKDPRWKYINAWNGWDGEGGAGRYDVITGNVSTATSDHKWHIHLEIRRKYVNDMTAMRAILSLLKGEPYSAPKPATPATPTKPTTPPVVAPKPPVGEKDMTKEEMLALLRSPEGREAIGFALLSTKTGNKAYEARTVQNFFNDVWGIRDYFINDPKGAEEKISWVAANTRLAKLAALADADLVDEAAIANAILSNPAFVDGFAAAVASKLPPGVQASPEQLAAAFKTALREGVAE